MTNMWVVIFLVLFLRDVSGGTKYVEYQCSIGDSLFQKTCYQFSLAKYGGHYPGVHGECSWDHSDGHVIMVKSRKQQDFVNTQMKRLNLKGDDLVWLGLKFDTVKRKYLWSDGESLDYENFDDSLLGGGIRVGDCVVMNVKSGKWSAESCQEKYSSVLCQYAPEAITYTGCPKTLTRDKYLKKKGDKCYYFYLNEKKEFVEAREVCENDGGILATVKSRGIQDFFKFQMEYRLDEFFDDFFIGLTDENKMDEFVWEDGSKLEYENFWRFARDSSELLRKYMSCVYVSPSRNWKWVNGFCTYTFVPRSKAFVCEYPNKE